MAKPLDLDEIEYKVRDESRSLNPTTFPEDDWCWMLRADALRLIAELREAREYGLQMRESRRASKEIAAKLSKQLTKARRDTERLDWLEEQTTILHEDMNVACCDFPLAETDNSTTLREAIDAAQREKNNG